MEKNPFIDDILSQPEALRQCVSGYDPTLLQDIAKDLKAGRFDRILLTGMGSSTFGSYPAWLHLAQAGLPTWWVETGELLHYTPQLITPRTLLWVISQSGQTAEAVSLVDSLKSSPPALILAATNEPGSPLAAASGCVLPFNAGRDFSVGTRTYTNTLAVTQLAALQMTGSPLDPAQNDLLAAASAMQAYFDGWQEQVDRLAHAVGVPQRLIILGRGDSWATAQTAALVLKEGAKFHAESLTAGQFRHGPIELTDPRLTVIAIEGDAENRSLNLGISRDVLRFGGRAFYVSPQPQEGLPAMLQPRGSGIGRVVCEIAPFQILALAICQQTGVAPGIFLHAGKVVLSE
ncbi:MAG: SIS domain-containing protein [Chloroflexi bacterium]|nr:SIS domain-containing protein [Chloroflexota bacterium]